MNIRKRIYNIIGPGYLTEDGGLSEKYHFCMSFVIGVSIVPLMFRGHWDVFKYFDVIPAIIFVIDYILRWITADYELKKGKLSFFIYPFTLMAIIDLLSILPTIHMLSPTFKAARITRLLRILRVVKFIRYYEPLEIIMAVVRRQGQTLWTVFSLAAFYIFITALIMFNAEEDINPSTGDYLFPTFFDAIYWAACTLTTVGYGDIYPVSQVGRFISMISAFVGVAIVALPSGIITAGYLDELKARRERQMSRKLMKQQNQLDVIDHELD
jgi:voltage-gated potassium channel